MNEMLSGVPFEASKNSNPEQINDTLKNENSHASTNPLLKYGKIGMVAIGLTAGVASAQEISSNQNIYNKTEIKGKEESIQHVRSLEQMRSKDSTEERLAFFEREVDSIITGRVQFSPEQVSHIFDDIITPGFNQLYLAGMADTTKRPESERAKFATRKLIDYLYAEKSPFAELPGETYLTFPKGVDLVLPTTEARMIFNFVMNKKFTLKNVYNDKIELDSNHKVNFADVQFMKAKGDNSISVQLRVEPIVDASMVANFVVSVIDKKGKHHTFFFDLNQGENKGLGQDNATYTEIKQVFSEIFKQ